MGFSCCWGVWHDFVMIVMVLKGHKKFKAIFVTQGLGNSIINKSLFYKITITTQQPPCRVATSTTNVRLSTTFSPNTRKLLQPHEHWHLVFTFHVEVLFLLGTITLLMHSTTDRYGWVKWDVPVHSVPPKKLWVGTKILEKILWGGKVWWKNEEIILSRGLTGGYLGSLSELSSCFKAK